MAHVVGVYVSLGMGVAVKHIERRLAQIYLYYIHLCDVSVCLKLLYGIDAVCRTSNARTDNGVHLCAVWVGLYDVSVFVKADA